MQKANKHKEFKIVSTTPGLACFLYVHQKSFEDNQSCLNFSH